MMPKTKGSIKYVRSLADFDNRYGSKTKTTKLKGNKYYRLGISIAEMATSKLTDGKDRTKNIEGKST